MEAKASSREDADPLPIQEARAPELPSGRDEAPPDQARVQRSQTNQQARAREEIPDHQTKGYLKDNPSGQE